MRLPIQVTVAYAPVACRLWRRTDHDKVLGPCVSPNMDAFLSVAIHRVVDCSKVAGRSHLFAEPLRTRIFALQYFQNSVARTQTFLPGFPSAARSFGARSRGASHPHCPGLAAAHGLQMAAHRRRVARRACSAREGASRVSCTTAIPTEILA